MLARHPPPRPKRAVPTCWLMLDARMGESTTTTVAAMPPRSAVVVRPYAMQREARAALIRRVRHIARAKRHLLLLAGPGSAAGYDGRHGNGILRPAKPVRFRSQAVHGRAELRRAIHSKADAVLISPVWPTRSHEGAAVLGRRGFARLAAASAACAIGLGGMTATRFRALRRHGAAGWAAIDAWLLPEA